MYLLANGICHTLISGTSVNKAATVSCDLKQHDFSVLESDEVAECLRLFVIQFERVVAATATKRDEGTLDLAPGFEGGRQGRVRRNAGVNHWNPDTLDMGGFLEIHGLQGGVLYKRTQISLMVVDAKGKKDSLA